jgi:[ribosomal protein S5]-alanine N-acetyltransferase
MYQIYSPRVALRLVTDSDSLQVSSILGNKDTMEYILGTAQTLEQSNERLNMWLNYNKQVPKLGIFLIYEIASKQLIGYAVARHVNYEIDNNQYEVGYAFLPEYWGKGLATELVPYQCKYIFEQTNCTSINAFTDPLNMNSKKVLEKNNFSPNGFVPIYGGSDAFIIDKETFYAHNNVQEMDIIIAQSKHSMQAI